jgi:hypothetical protein
MTAVTHVGPNLCPRSDQRAFMLVRALRWVRRCSTSRINQGCCLAWADSRERPSELRQPFALVLAAFWCFRGGFVAWVASMILTFTGRGVLMVVGPEALSAGGTLAQRDGATEATTPSVSTRSSWTADLGVWLYALVRALVVIGVGECWRRLFARSSPRFLPKLGWLPAGPASRRAGFARPGRVRLVQVERPAGRTTWTRRARSCCLRCAMGRDARPDIPESPRSRGGAPAARGRVRIGGPETLPAGGRRVRYLSLTSLLAGSARSPPPGWSCSRYAGRPSDSSAVGKPSRGQATAAA